MSVSLRMEKEEEVRVGLFSRRWGWGGVTARMVRLIIIKNKTKLIKCILHHNPTPLNQILVKVFLAKNINKLSTFDLLH